MELANLRTLEYCLPGANRSHTHFQNKFYDDAYSHR
jgi:hypothetical protein